MNEFSLLITFVMEEHTDFTKWVLPRSVRFCTHSGLMRTCAGPQRSSSDVLGAVFGAAALVAAFGATTLAAMLALSTHN